MPTTVQYNNANAQILAGLVAEAFADSTAHLFVADEITPTRNTTNSQFSAAECSFPGYAAKTITALSGPVSPPEGGAKVFTGLLLWEAGVVVTGEEIGGGWLADAGDQVLLYWVLDTPVPIAAFGDYYAVDIAQTWFQMP